MNRLYILLVVLITSCSNELEKSLIIDKIPDDPVLTISIKEFENVNFQTLEFISESVDFDFLHSRYFIKCHRYLYRSYDWISIYNKH